MRDLDEVDRIAIGHHMENRNRFPPEELEKYRGQYIAWSLDGTRIIAHADDPETLDALLLQLGDEGERCVHSCFPEEDTMGPWSALAPLKPSREAKEADNH